MSQSRLSSLDIEGHPLCEESLSLIVGRSHPRASRRKALTAADFGKEPLVLLNGAFATRQYIDSHCVRHRIQPLVVVEADSISAIVEIVRRGQLATVLPDRIAHGQEGLRLISLKPLLSPRTVAILQRKNAYRTAASKAFVRLLAEQYGKRKNEPIAVAGRLIDR